MNKYVLYSTQRTGLNQSLTLCCLQTGPVEVMNVKRNHTTLGMSNDTETIDILLLNLFNNQFGVLE